MADWLSFWSAETRERLDLDGKPINDIYVPYGEGQIQLGDTIYCVGIENGGLRLLTRIVATEINLDDDPDHNKSVRAVDNSSKIPLTDYKREVSDDVLAAMRLRYADGSEHSVLTEDDSGTLVDSHRFEGHSSLRRLVAGATELDNVLAPDASPAPRAIDTVRALADDYKEALDLLEDFCERFYWIKDHPDYQEAVREFLTARGRKPHLIG